jgi:hypothetical protein
MPPRHSAPARRRRVPRAHPLAKRSGVTLADTTVYAMVSLPRESQTRRLIDGLGPTVGMKTLEPVVVSHPVSSITVEEVAQRVAQIKEQAQQVWLGTMAPLRVEVELQ